MKLFFFLSFSFNLCVVFLPNIATLFAQTGSMNFDPYPVEDTYIITYRNSLKSSEYNHIKNPIKYDDFWSINLSKKVGNELGLSLATALLNRSDNQNSIKNITVGIQNLNLLDSYSDLTIGSSCNVYRFSQLFSPMTIRGSAIQTRKGDSKTGKGISSVIFFGDMPDRSKTSLFDEFGANNKYYGSGFNYHINKDTGTGIFILGGSDARRTNKSNISGTIAGLNFKTKLFKYFSLNSECSFSLSQMKPQYSENLLDTLDTATEKQTSSTGYGMMTEVDFKNSKFHSFTTFKYFTNYITPNNLQNLSTGKSVLFGISGKIAGPLSGSISSGLSDDLNTSMNNINYPKVKNKLLSTSGGIFLSSFSSLPSLSINYQLSNNIKEIANSSETKLNTSRLSIALNKNLGIFTTNFLFRRMSSIENIYALRITKSFSTMLSGFIEGNAYTGEIQRTFIGRSGLDFAILSKGNLKQEIAYIKDTKENYKSYFSTNSYIYFTPLSYLSFFISYNGEFYAEGNKRNNFSIGATTSGNLSLSNTVKGRVFEDVNSNGIYDSGDKPLKGVKVKLGLNEYETDKDGKYSFKKTTSEKEKVKVNMRTLPASFKLTSPSEQEITTTFLGNKNVDFSVQRTGKIKGRIFVDSNKNFISDNEEAGVSFVIVYAQKSDMTPLKTLTDKDGYFSFYNVIPGEYKVIIYPKKWLDEYQSLKSDTLTVTISGGATIDIALPVVKVERASKVTFRSGEAKSIGTIYFDFGKTEITPESEKILHLSAIEIKKCAEIGCDILIAGHTDDIEAKTPEFHYKMELSKARAVAVMNYLKDKEGITNFKLITIGYSDTKRIDTSDTESGRSKNRRVEIKIRKQ